MRLHPRPPQSRARRRRCRRAYVPLQPQQSLRCRAHASLVGGRTPGYRRRRAAGAVRLAPTRRRVRGVARRKQDAVPGGYLSRKAGDPELKPEARVRVRSYGLPSSARRASFARPRLRMTAQRQRIDYQAGRPPSPAPWRCIASSARARTSSTERRSAGSSPPTADRRPYVPPSACHPSARRPCRGSVLAEP